MAQQELDAVYGVALAVMSLGLDIGIVAIPHVLCNAGGSVWAIILAFIGVAESFEGVGTPGTISESPVTQLSAMGLSMSFLSATLSLFFYSEGAC
jgi:hypothetical protein